MIDTDKYEIPKYEDAKKVVQDAGLIEENDGHPDIFYRKIAQLLAEVKRLREDYKRVRAKYVAALDYVVEGYAYCEPCERGCFVEQFTDGGDDICVWCDGVIE